MTANIRKWLLSAALTCFACAGHAFFCSDHPGGFLPIELAMFPILVVLGRVYFEYF
jgi:hypothetical protein